MSNDAAAAMMCPGCHFGCALQRYQCGRGKEFYELVASGQPLPERCWPMFTPSEQQAGRGGRPPLNERVMKGLGFASHAMSRHVVEGAEQKLLGALAHSGGIMSKPILAKRAQLSRDELEAQLGQAIDRGWVETRVEQIAPLSPEAEDARPSEVEFACLTEAGAAQAQAADNERQRQTEEFLQPLSTDEREQLDRLLFKLMQAHRGKHEQGAERGQAAKA